MLAPGLIIWGQFITVPDEATDVEVLGVQWSWNYRLPGADGKLGQIGQPADLGFDNPSSVSVESDEAGKDDIIIEGDDLHLPIGKAGQDAPALGRCAA